jgi:hypothetical protein
MSSNTGKALKVFEGAGFVGGPDQVKIIVAATSRKSAIAALREHGIRETESHMASHWRTHATWEGMPLEETFNRAVEAAGTPFATSTYSDPKYRAVPKDANAVAQLSQPL